MIIRNPSLIYIRIYFDIFFFSGQKSEKTYLSKTKIPQYLLIVNIVVYETLYIVSIYSNDLFFKKVNEQQFIDNDTYYNLFSI